MNNAQGISSEVESIKIFVLTEYILDLVTNIGSVCIQRNPPTIPRWMTLKGKCHEIFSLWFFHQTTSPSPVRHAKKGFQIFFEYSRS
jgi:hypothetical protein